MKTLDLHSELPLELLVIPNEQQRDLYREFYEREQALQLIDLHTELPLRLLRVQLARASRR